MKKEKNQTVLITGAADRIGGAIAAHLAGLGWDIAIHYHSSEDKAKKLADSLQKQYKIQAVALQADLRVSQQRMNLFKETNKIFGTIDALINNAALFNPQGDTIDQLDDDLWNQHLETNTRAPLHLSQLFAKQLSARKSGNIINLLDQRVWNLSGAFLSYTVSKAALWTLTQTLAIALAPNIRVNGIGPGMVLPAAGQTMTHFRQRLQNTPLKRSIDPKEIAEAVAFILGSPSFTGQMIALDGGEHLVKKLV